MNRPPAKKKNWAGRMMRVMRTARSKVPGSVIPGASMRTKKGVQMIPAAIPEIRISPNPLNTSENTSNPLFSRPWDRYLANTGIKVIDKNPLATTWLRISGRAKAIW